MLDKIPGAEILTEQDVILVTGGNGLFGSAIRDIVTKMNLKGKWVYLSSKDADLRNFDPQVAHLIGGGLGR